MNKYTKPPTFKQEYQSYNQVVLRLNIAQKILEINTISAYYGKVSVI